MMNGSSITQYFLLTYILMSPIRPGVGKSALLKILSRITEPTEVRGTIRGRVASLLEEGTGFHPELTG